jgi:hypothetical protein
VHQIAERPLTSGWKRCGPQIEHALKGGTSLRKEAEEFNARGIESPRGGRWHAHHS